ncbi:hypothetical protein QFZ96_000396 [Paraburkholderia youngii]
MPSGRMPHLCENTGIPPASSGISRVATLKSKRIVSRSITTARAICPKYTANCGSACGLFSVSNENFTSAAVTGSPFEKRALGLMWKVVDRPSLATSMSSASRQYALATSSALPVVRLSNISPSPGAGLPRSVNGLNLSKLVSRFGFASTSVPSRGASGLT